MDDIKQYLIKFPYQLVSILSEPQKGNVRVVVRVRPFLPREEKISPILIKGESILIQTQDNQPRQFQFDAILGPDATQQQVYEASAQQIIKDYLQGANTCILCSGMTSSGKTYTCGLNNQVTDGIVYRSLYDIFKGVQGFQYDIQMSFFQIYNDRLDDLLRNDVGKQQHGLNSSQNNSAKPKANSQIQLKQVDASTFEIANSVIARPQSLQEALEIVQNAMHRRAVAATVSNEQSSRSHTIFQVRLVLKRQNGIISRSTLQIVDLAGSERVARSRVEGDRFIEAVNINKSLSHLGKVVSALSTGSQFIPIRNSILTKALSQTLVGNCRTVLIATLCPTVQTAHESVSTLQFAKSCREVVQTVTFNIEETQRFLQSLQHNYSGDGYGMLELGQNGEQALSKQQLETLQEFDLEARNYTFDEVINIIMKVKQSEIEKGNIVLMESRYLNGISQELKEIHCNASASGYTGLQDSQMFTAQLEDNQAKSYSNMVGEVEKQLYSLIQQNQRGFDYIASMMKDLEEHIGKDQVVESNYYYKQVIKNLIQDGAKQGYVMDLLKNITQMDEIMQKNTGVQFLNDNNTHFKETVEIIKTALENDYLQQELTKVQPRLSRQQQQQGNIYKQQLAQQLTDIEKLKSFLRLLQTQLSSDILYIARVYKRIKARQVPSYDALVLQHCLTLSNYAQVLKYYHNASKAVGEKLID